MTPVNIGIIQLSVSQLGMWLYIIRSEDSKDRDEENRITAGTSDRDQTLHLAHDLRRAMSACT